MTRRHDSNESPLWLLRGLRELLEPHEGSASVEEQGASPHAWARMQDVGAEPVASRVLGWIKSVGGAAKKAVSSVVTKAKSAIHPQVNELLAVIKSAETRLAAPFKASPRGSAVVGSPIASWVSDVPLEYAGASLSTGDFNGDGIADVTIGAWGRTTTGGAARKLLQAGAVYTRVSQLWARVLLRGSGLSPVFREFTLHAHASDGQENCGEVI